MHSHNGIGLLLAGQMVGDLEPIGLLLWINRPEEEGQGVLHENDSHRNSTQTALQEISLLYTDDEEC